MEKGPDPPKTRDDRDDVKFTLKIPTTCNVFGHPGSSDVVVDDAGNRDASAKSSV